MNSRASSNRRRGALPLKALHSNTISASRSPYATIQAYRRATLSPRHFTGARACHLVTLSPCLLGCSVARAPAGPASAGPAIGQGVAYCVALYRVGELQAKRWDIASHRTPFHPTATTPNLAKGVEVSGCHPQIKPRRLSPLPRRNGVLLLYIYIYIFI